MQTIVQRGDNVMIGFCHLIAFRVVVDRLTGNMTKHTQTISVMRFERTRREERKEENQKKKKQEEDRE